MSMVIGMVGKEAIVMAADTICMVGDDSGYYNDSHSKLYKASNPKFAIGLAGSRGADKFLRVRNEWTALDFDETTRAYKGIAFEDYQHGNTSYDFYYLMGGYDRDGQPRLERVRFVRDNYNSGRPVSDIASVNSKHAIGLEKHGAWYLLANYFDKDMSTDQTMLLSYLILSEVLRHDRRTRGPIEMMVVKAGMPVSEVLPAHLEELKRESEKRIADVSGIFRTPFVMRP
jgi:20S proteasome alpha/beta subunit